MNRNLLILSQDAQSRATAARILRARQIDAQPCAAAALTGDLLADCCGVIVADAWDGLQGLLPLLIKQPVLWLNRAAVRLCECCGGTAAEQRQVGLHPLALQQKTLFAELESGEYMLHDVTALQLSAVLQPIETSDGQCLGFCTLDGNQYGVQYPMERNDPVAGQLLWNFAVRICGAKESLTEESMLAEICENLDAARGEVLLTVTGGVDSSVCAVLAHRVLGPRLHCVLVNNGMLRKDERESIADLFDKHLKVPLEILECENRFLHALKDLHHAQRKESAARACLSEVLNGYLEAHPQIESLILATNVNDLLNGDRYCTPSEGLQVVEPLRRLFKDEIRGVADSLELPPAIVSRQPFPATGLCNRIYGEVTVERLRLLRAADDCFCRRIREGGYDRKLYQYYATLTVNPDSPDSYAVCLRAVQAVEGGAVAARLPFDVLESAADEILTQYPMVKRVLYDLSPSAHYAKENR